MAPEFAADLAEALKQARTAVQNAKMRSRLRGELLELVVAGERLDDAERILEASRSQ